MTEQQVREQIHQILDSHADVLASIRSAHASMALAFKAHDDALVSAIEANGAALKLLNRLMNEGLNDRT
jgi:hypothetical protein